jgi:hypothetical protein
MAHPTFAPSFHPTFLRTSHAWEAPLTLPLRCPFTILLRILANDFHMPVKTRIGIWSWQASAPFAQHAKKNKKFFQKGGE